MKLYRTCVAGRASETAEPLWAGSQAEAGKHRKELNQRGHKRADISTDEVEVPTNKTGLLEWLNKNGV